MIAIIAGCGANIASIQFALTRLRKKSILTNDITTIKSASHVILPGVGTAMKAMDQLKKYQLVDAICELQQPILGICLGMQILYSFSAEKSIHCLGIFKEKISRLPEDAGLSTPHMGWNQLEIILPATPLIKNIPDRSYVYYVHSYAAPIHKNTIAMTKHGSQFSAIVQDKNFYGVQFHPERSGKIGEMILQNFVNIE